MSVTTLGVWREIAGEGRGDHRGTEQPPGHFPPGEKEVGGAPPRPPADPDTHCEAEGEESEDHCPVDAQQLRGAGDAVQPVGDSVEQGWFSCGACLTAAPVGGCRAGPEQWIRWPATGTRRKNGQEGSHGREWTALRSVFGSVLRVSQSPGFCNAGKRVVREGT